MDRPSKLTPAFNSLFTALLAAIIACGGYAPYAIAEDVDEQEAVVATQAEAPDAAEEDEDAVPADDEEASEPLRAEASDLDGGVWSGEQGDGTIEWRIDTDGTLWIYPGKTPSCGSKDFVPDWLVSDNRNDVKKAVFVKQGNNMVVDRGRTGNLGSIPLLMGCENLEEVDLTGLDVSNMEHDPNLSELFSGCSSLTTVDLSPLDTSNITDMSHMFDGCSSLTCVDLSMLNLSKLENTGCMFRDCPSLATVDFPSSGTLPLYIAQSMFEGCSSLETLDLSSFDTTQASYVGIIFKGCTNLKTIYVSDKWDLTYMIGDGWYVADGRTSMFDGCTSLEGGSGTTYDSANKGYQYACIDTPETPGYLTRKGASFPYLSYAFSNSWEGFGYPSGYVIPLQRYELLFGSKRAKVFQEADGAWGGNCYGMSSSSSMMSTNGSGILASGFNAGAGRPRALGNRDFNASIGLDLTAFIEVMQVSQHDDSYGQAFYDNAGAQRVLDYVREQTAAGHPVVVCVFSTPSGGGGHAILAYGVERSSDGGWQILVYDNNWPEHGRAIHVSTDSSGKATGWSYELWQGMTYYNGRLVYVPYETYVDVWNGRNASRTGGTTNVLSTNSRDFELYDATGNLMAVVEDGVLQEGASESVWQHHTMRATETNVDDELDVLLTLPNGLCRVENKDASVDKLEASVSDQEQVASVKTVADSVELVVDDTTASTVATLAPGSGAYEIRLESALPQAKGKEVVEVTGTLTGAGASVGMAGGALDTSMAAGATVKINGQQQVDAKPEQDKPQPTKVTGIANGKTAVVGGATYKVKSNAKGTAYYHKAPKSKKSVTVPAKVTINGKTYKVVGISKNAFKGTKAKTVTIKTSSLTKKSVKGAFKGAKKLKTVKVKVGSKSANKKALKKYKKIFTKKNAGKKVMLK